MPVGVEIWGAFLILVGIGLLIFNKRWAAWAAPLTPLGWVPIGDSAKTAIGRVLTVLVGMMFFLAGVSVWLPVGPGPR